MATSCPHCCNRCEIRAGRCSQCGAWLLLAERFELRERLGEGGQGYVCLGWDRVESRPVAIKVVALQHADDWKTLELFARGSQVLQNLAQHPGIPRVFAHQQDAAGRHYQVREYFSGGSLQTRFQAAASHDRKAVHVLLRDLLEILVHLHSQLPTIVHRDIKPSNVMFRNDQDRQPVLVDFDTVASAPRSETGTTIVVSPGYTAPEQLIGAAVPASDLFSLGMTMLFVLTGESPEELPRREGALQVEAVCAPLEPATRRVIMRSISPDLATRYKTAREALRDLKDLNRNAVAPAQIAPATSRSKRLLWSVLRICVAVVLGAMLQYAIWLGYYRFRTRVLVEDEGGYVR